MIDMNTANAIARSVLLGEPAPPSESFAERQFRAQFAREVEQARERGLKIDIAAEINETFSSLPPMQLSQDWIHPKR